MIDHDAYAIDLILQKHDYQHSRIIGIIQDIQAMENYLPEEVLRYVSRKMEISLTRVYDIVTFYKSFSLKPRGRNTIKVCCGTACHLNGAPQILQQLKRLLNINARETTEDLMFSLETVNCLGACALAPVVVVGGEYFESVDVGKIEKILSSYRAEREEDIEKD